MIRSYSFANRQFQPEFAALTEAGFNPDLPPHTLHRLPHYGQADAGAFIFMFMGGALEHSKNAFLILQGNADAVILQPKPHFGIARFGPNSDYWKHARRNKLYRI